MVDSIQPALIIWAFFAGVGSGGARFLRAYTDHKIVVHFLKRDEAPSSPR